MRIKSVRVKWIVVIVLLVSAGILLWYNQTKRNLPKNAVKLPNSGILVLKNELVILAPRENVERVASEFGGKITISVPETDSYQVRFPVKNFEELDLIKNELNERGIQTVYSYLFNSPGPNEPQ